MEVSLDSPLPDGLVAGCGTALFLAGAASGRFTLTVDGEPHRPWAQGLRPGGRWWAVVPVRPQEPSVTLRAGTQTLATLPVVGETRTTARERSPTVAVCMATFDPDPGLFRRQVDSLRAQTDTDWACTISDDASPPASLAAIEAAIEDDARFTLHPSETRQGFHRNFERAITLAPESAGLVALCDQDDVWYPEKLATLRAALGDAPLAYSDQRLVTPDGTLVRPSLWGARQPNHESLLSLLIAGGITGASMLMRRDVADLAVPFPDTPGMDFHDHWIALVARAHGEIRYVDRPLYDYVQHGGAVFGARRDIPQSRGLRWRSAYFGGYVQRAVLATALRERTGAALELPGVLRLAARGLRRRPDTLGSELELAGGLLWRRLARLARDTRTPDRWTFQQKRLRDWRWG